MLTPDDGPTRLEKNLASFDHDKEIRKGFDDHDCHASEEDGCEGCELIGNTI